MTRWFPVRRIPSRSASAGSRVLVRSSWNLARIGFVVGVFAGLGGLLGALSPDELATARKKFEIWRQYPEQLEKFRLAAESFANLPVERQRQLEQIDLDLANEPSASQARLHDALDRYSEWLNRLPPADRDRVRQASDSTSRLAIIRELRDNDWLARQPKATRDAISKAPENERGDLVARARAEERRRLEEWSIARRFWDDLARNRPLPVKLADFDVPTQTFVTDVLMRILSKDEREQLVRAEGKWPLYPRTLVELADRHPPALRSSAGPSSMAELPKIVRDSLGKKAIATLKEKVIEKRMRAFEGRYPEFAMKLTSLASENNWVMPVEWWPYNFHGLTLPMQDFLKKKLEPLLDRKEARLLVDAEGKWPEYPETIQKLAQSHNLEVPWFTLPGSRERWDVYRAGPRPTVPGYPELPKYKLRDFVSFDLDEFDRMKFKNEIERARGKSDECWSYLVDLYFQTYPGELARLRQIDREKLNPRKP